MDIKPSTTTRDARLHFSELFGISFPQLLLILHGVVLSDGTALSTLNLTPDDFIVIYTPKVMSRRVRQSIAAAPVIIPPVAADRKPLPEMMEGDISAPIPPPHRDVPPPSVEPPDVENRLNQVLDRAGRDPNDPSRDYVRRLLATCHYDVDQTVASFLDQAFDDARKAQKKQAKPSQPPPKPPPPVAPPKEPEIDYTAALGAFNFRDFVKYIQDMKNTEKASLLRLCQEFGRTDPYEVMQYFMFSDKIYEKTADNLRRR